MTPDEKEMQEKKIARMDLALMLGMLFGIAVILLLAGIFLNTLR